MCQPLIWCCHQLTVMVKGLSGQKSESVVVDDAHCAEAVTFAPPKLLQILVRRCEALLQTYRKAVRAFGDVLNWTAHVFCGVLNKMPQSVLDIIANHMGIRGYRSTIIFVSSPRELRIGMFLPKVLGVWASNERGFAMAFCNIRSPKQSIQWFGACTHLFGWHAQYFGVKIERLSDVYAVPVADKVSSKIQSRYMIMLTSWDDKNKKSRILSWNDR